MVGVGATRVLDKGHVWTRIEIWAIMIMLARLLNGDDAERLPWRSHEDESVNVDPVARDVLGQFGLVRLKVIRSMRVEVLSGVDEAYVAPCGLR